MSNDRESAYNVQAKWRRMVTKPFLARHHNSIVGKNIFQLGVGLSEPNHKRQHHDSLSSHGQIDPPITKRRRSINYKQFNARLRVSK